LWKTRSDRDTSSTATVCGGVKDLWKTHGTQELSSVKKRCTNVKEGCGVCSHGDTQTLYIVAAQSPSPNDVQGQTWKVF
jgi:hypothetical protein